MPDAFSRQTSPTHSMRRRGGHRAVVGTATYGTPSSCAASPVDLVSTWEQPLLRPCRCRGVSPRSGKILDKRWTGLSTSVREVRPGDDRAATSSGHGHAVASRARCASSGGMSTGLTMLLAATYPERCSRPPACRSADKGIRSSTSRGPRRLDRATRAARRRARAAGASATTWSPGGERAPRSRCGRRPAAGSAGTSGAA